MNDLIICHFCDYMFDEPRFLPCGENICNCCIKNVVNKVNCVYCEEVHEIPLSGFPVNKQLKLLMKRMSKSYVKLQEVKQELKNLQDMFESPKEMITSYIRTISDQVELKARLKIKEITNLRSDLTTQLSECEQDCLEYFEANKETILDEKYSFIINRIKQTISDRSLLDEENVKKLDELKQDLLSSCQELKEAILNGDNLFFEPSNLNFNPIGSLKSSKINVFDRKKMSSFHLIDYSNTYPLDNTYIRVVSLKNSNFAVCYISDTNKLTLEIHDFKTRNRLHYFEYSSKITYNSILRSHGDYIILVEINSKFIVLFDLSLNKIAESTNVYTVTSVFFFQKYIGILDNTRQENKSYIHLLDYNLESLFAVSNDSMSASFPNPIKYVITNEELSFFRETDHLNILNKTGGLVNRLKFASDLRIIGVSSINLIVYNSNNKCVVYMDFSGKQVRKIDLTNFNETSLDIIVEQNEKLVFIDYKKWVIMRI